MHAVLLLLLLLQIKHLIVDWIWQPKYEWSNKGKYGHFGGIRHAGKNAIGTALCFAFFQHDLWTVLVFKVLIVDFLIHYHIDWCKMNVNRMMNWGPLTHCEFWWLTGFDQFLHQVTYLFLIVMFFS